MIRVRRVHSFEVAELVERAAADDHEVLLPTHVVERAAADEQLDDHGRPVKEELVGYLSIGAVPVVNVWMDSKKLKVRDSLTMLGQLEAIMNHSGMDAYFLPCAEKSPYYGLSGS